MAAVDRKAFSRILVEVFAHYTAFVRDGRPFFSLWTIQLFSVIEMKLSINEYRKCKIDVFIQVFEITLQQKNCVNAVNES